MNLAIPFLAALKKELRLLYRDPTGLLILFFMPAALVLIITLVQNNIMEKIGDSASELLVVNMDKGALAEKIIHRLQHNPHIHLILRQKRDQVTQDVNEGRYQAAIFLEQGLSNSVQHQVEAQVNAMADITKDNRQTTSPGKINLLFTPTAIGAYRSTITTTVKLLALGLEYEATMQAITQMVQEMSPPFSARENTPPPNIGRYLQVKELAQTKDTIPTAVQQNVPAWTIFGIFFIVVPLSASLLQEQNSGTLARLRVMPAPLGLLLLGKVAAYGLVCLGQCLLIWAIGRFLLPQFGLPAFVISQQPGAIGLLLLALIGAATSYGILLGTLCHTYDQAAMFGAISVVMAAAIGGIMAPVHAMPHTMQILSKISPLGWALEGMLTIFVRHGTIWDIVTPISLLLTFALFCVGLAWFFFRKN